MNDRTAKAKVQEVIDAAARDPQSLALIATMIGKLAQVVLWLVSLAGSRPPTDARGYRRDQ